MSKVKQMKDSLDWIMKDGASKYGSIDKDKIVAAGQSCGGLEACVPRLARLQADEAGIQRATMNRG